MEKENVYRMEKGFSLVELLIVMALIGIMLAIGGLALNTQLPKYHMNGTARDIAGKLMMARLKAVQNNAVYGMSFTPGAGGSYVPVKNSGSWVNDGGVTQATADVTIDAAGAGCLNNRTEFYQNGTVLGCDTINVTSSDGKLMSITIELITGHVQVQ